MNLPKHVRTTVTLAFVIESQVWDDQIVVGRFVEPLSLTIMQKVQDFQGVLMVAPVTNSPKIVKDKVKRGIEGFGIACDRMRGETNIVTLIYDAPYFVLLL